MPSLHHEVLLNSSPLYPLFQDRKIGDAFAVALREIERRDFGNDPATDKTEDPTEYIENTISSWRDLYKRFRLVPDAYFIIDSGKPNYAELRGALESVTGPLDLQNHVSLFVCMEADLSSALSNDKLIKYGEWWMWFDSTETVHLIVICIDRYGKHTLLDNNLLLHAFLANVAQSGTDNRSHGIQEAVEAD